MYVSLKKQNSSKSKKDTLQLCPKMRARKSRFTKEEDLILEALVRELGTDWKKIAACIPNRTPRQCKDRWTNYLNPPLNAPFSMEDVHRLSRLFQEYGPKWKKIQPYFPGRTCNELKNLYKNVVAHELRRPVPDRLEHINSSQSTTCVLSVIDFDDFIFQSGGGLHAEDRSEIFLDMLSSCVKLPAVCDTVLSVSKSPCSSEYGTNPGDSGCQEKLTDFVLQPHGQTCYNITLAPTKPYQPHGVPNAKECSRKAMDGCNLIHFDYVRQ